MRNNLCPIGSASRRKEAAGQNRNENDILLEKLGSCGATLPLIFVLLPSRAFSLSLFRFLKTWSGDCETAAGWIASDKLGAT